MTRAIIKNGKAEPLPLLPPDWPEGTEVQLEKLSQPEGNGVLTKALDVWKAELEALAAEIDPEDDERVAQALALIRKEAKEIGRQEKT